MRVALYGNTCNNFYVLAKALKEKLGFDAHLYLNPEVDFQNRPESDDPELLNNYPHWIHIDSHWNPVKFWTRFDRRFVKELNQYDIVFFSDLGPILAPFIKGKTFFYTMGQDVTKFPFPSLFPGKFTNPINRLKGEYVGLLQRRGIKACDRILTQPFYPFTRALEKLKVNAKQISTAYFPILIDTDKIQSRENAWKQISEENRKKIEKFKFIIFHPSRMMIKSDKAEIETGQWKANDQLIKGFAQFLKSTDVKDACLVLIDRYAFKDTETAKTLVKELGIEENVVWLKPTTFEGFPRNELINYYSISDIVADDFGVGWFGYVVVEAMACKKPVIAYADENVMEQLYPWHPIISAKQPAEIGNRIAEFYFDKEKRKQQGELSRQWVEEFHSIKNGTNIYIENFKKEFGEFFQ